VLELLERVTRRASSRWPAGSAARSSRTGCGAPRRRLSVVVNTGDDCERHGLLVMPDHDTVLYNLAGIEQVEWGWGIEGDTHATMDQLGATARRPWFRSATATSRCTSRGRAGSGRAAG
jgi:LPPG:FO 2-phospho-L-lactate transferase